MPLNNQIIVPKYIATSGIYQETVLTSQEIQAYPNNNPSGFITSVSLTYSQLTGLKASNNLIPGATYKITDFTLMWWNQSMNDLTVKSGIIEPIIVTAIGNNSISSEAKSEIYKNDIIYYDIDAKSSKTWGIWNKSIPIPNFKGWIYRRVDTSSSIDIGWDWRHITHNCMKVDISNILRWTGSYGPYNSIGGYGFDYPKNTVVKYSGKLYYCSNPELSAETPPNDFNGVYVNNVWTPLTAYTEEDQYFPSIGQTTPFYPVDQDSVYALYVSEPRIIFYKSFYDPLLILNWKTGSSIQLPTFSSITNGSGVTNLTGIQNIYIREGFNTVIDVSSFSGPSTVYPKKIDNTQIDNSFNNLFWGENFKNNNLGFAAFNIISNFQDNKIGAMSRCIFAGPYSTDNTLRTMDRVASFEFTRNIADFIGYSLLGKNFSNNNVTTIMDSTISSNFINNNIRDNFRYNIIGSYFTNNRIGYNFTNNIIGSNFINNLIGNSFTANGVANNFSFNELRDNCSNNFIEDNFSYNSIKNNFKNNDVFSDFIYNTIDNNFSGNLFESQFQNNTIENNIYGVDFTMSTYAYQPYSKTIFKDINGNTSLRYFNENKQIVVVDANA